MINPRLLEAALVASLSGTRPRPTDYAETAEEHTRRYRQWHSDVRAVSDALGRFNRTFDAELFIEAVTHA